MIRITTPDGDEHYRVFWVGRFWVAWQKGHIWQIRVGRMT